MTTVADIIAGGLGRSYFNRADVLANESSELVSVIGQELFGLFLVAARVSPEYFGYRAIVGFSGTGWQQPSNLESVWLIQNPDGETVYAVSPHDVRAAEGSPSVMLLSGVYVPTNIGDGPDDGNLSIYGSRYAAGVTTVDSEIDPAWPIAFNPLLELRVTIYLAAKDRRADDVERFDGEWNSWFSKYVLHLEHHYANQVRRTRIPETASTPALAILKQMVTGGEKATP